VRTRDLEAKLSAVAPDQLPTVDQARVLTRERRKEAEAAMRARVKERVAARLKPLAAKQATRRLSALSLPPPSTPKDSARSPPPRSASLP
jgi:hypothetical protein